MRPTLHRRTPRETCTSDLSSESYDSYRSSYLRSLSPLLRRSRSPRSPIPIRPSPKYNCNAYTFWILTAFISLILIIFWIYFHYQFGKASNRNKLNTNAFYPYQYSSISSSNFNLFSQRLNIQCREAYSHSLSNIGDIDLMISDHVPFLQFLTFSDYGIIKDRNVQNENVQSLLQLINVMNSHLGNTHFIISAGDHFYDNNVNYAFHYRWKAMFSHFTKDKIFLSVAGNKDWTNTSNVVDIQNINAQIDRTYWSHNWCLPKLYYTVRFVFNNNVTDTLSFNIRFIALDTTSYLKQYHHFEYLSEQYKWLEHVLETNKNDDWIIVFGHHPFEQVPDQTKQKRSNDSNQQNKRNSPNMYTFEELQRERAWNHKMEKMLRLLLKYDNVMMYISGHHHIWRVCNIMDKNGKIKLLSIVTGSTGRHNHYFNKDLPLHKIAGGEEQSFGKITIFRNMFKVQIIDKENQTLFSHLYHKYAE